MVYYMKYNMTYDIMYYRISDTIHEMIPYGIWDRTWFGLSTSGSSFTEMSMSISTLDTAVTKPLPKPLLLFYLFLFLYKYSTIGVRWHDLHLLCLRVGVDCSHEQSRDHLIKVDWCRCNWCLNIHLNVSIHKYKYHECKSIYTDKY